MAATLLTLLSCAISLQHSQQAALFAGTILYSGSKAGTGPSLLCKADGVIAWKQASRPSCGRTLLRLELAGLF